MRKTLLTIGLLVALVGSYFLLWPIEIEPLAWQAPQDRGFIDPYAPNNLLTSATSINLGDHEGPEDATLGADGRIYVTTRDGSIVRVQNRGIDEFTKTGGIPLGIETASNGDLIVANAVSGIQRIDQSGAVTTLLDEIDGEPLLNANNIGIGPDGIIYFSQSSTKFATSATTGSYEASLLDIMEHGGHGNVYAFNPETGAVRRLMTGLNYANGVAVSDDGDFLLVAETGHYRILKYWLLGDQAGSTHSLIENLPGFPDNIKNGLNGRFWIGFAAPRNALLDQLSDKPLLRKVVQRLPATLRPQAEPLSHVIAINENGEVLMNLHDQSARFPTLTGVVETRSSLYLTTLFGRSLPKINKRDL